MVCRDQNMEVEDRGVGDDDNDDHDDDNNDDDDHDDEVLQKVEEDVEDLVVVEDRLLQATEVEAGDHEGVVVVALEEEQKGAAEVGFGGMAWLRAS